MTLLADVPVYTPWGKALQLFVRGHLGTGMTVLALGLEAMAQRAITTDVATRLRACAVAAQVFAQEWAALSTSAAARHAQLLVSPAAWIECPDCSEWLCTIHLQHVADCDCPAVEQWTGDPYTEGRYATPTGPAAR